MINRRRYRYTGSDILEYLFKCLCLRNLKLKKFEGSKEEWHFKYKKHFQFQEGEEKLNNELDVITLLKSMRRVKLLS
jgi:hypothetical protein